MTGGKSQEHQRSNRQSTIRPSLVPRLLKAMDDIPDCAVAVVIVVEIVVDFLVKAEMKLLTQQDTSLCSTFALR